MPRNINFALQVSGFESDSLLGVRVTDGESVTVKMSNCQGSNFDRRTTIEKLKGQVDIGGFVSIERWLEDAGDPNCCYAGYVHILSNSSADFDHRVLIDVMAKPSEPYGGLNHPIRAYVDVLNNKNTAIVKMAEARDTIVRSYMLNDYALGNPFVLLRDVKKEQLWYQLPVCYKTKVKGKYVRPTEKDIINALNEDPYSRFKRLMAKLNARQDNIEIVSGVRCQLSGALAQDSTYSAMRSKIYTAIGIDSKAVPNYRSSILSFKKHKTPGSEDYYISYLVPSLSDSGKLNLAGRVAAKDPSFPRT
ncbi:hypothetical protein N9L66_00395 [Porticoccaceae bacterium]|nr:hypothetical protein [Porticoccaceae bacterium]MDA8682044.1 hypothetical protein [Porticoccaceae bacterium]MDA8788779.1 hypothetical protein [Porticoccaceae bacterium]MDB2343060.1 hypothetical protein [Porticoccaceae bacterium]